MPPVVRRHRTRRKRSARTGCGDERNTRPDAAIPRRVTCPGRGHASARRQSTESCAWAVGSAASVDVTPETDRRLSLDQATRRHDQHAIVVGRAYLAAVVAAYQHALFGQYLEPAEVGGEIEAIAADR